MMTAQLRSGSRVFHPSHGVVSVLGRESRDFGDRVQNFYVLGLTLGGKLLVPVDNLAQSGVRDLVSSDKARELLDAVVGAGVAADPALSTGARAAAYSDGLASGSADTYTEILRELMHRAREKKLSPQDQKVLRAARRNFIAEISAVLERPDAEIEAALDEREE